ncbi:MAG: hypothetical protein ACR2N3_04585 [Pyrinomonadaceae bacterium]
MPTITEKIKVTTNADGSFVTEQIINPPGFWNYNITATARLLAPPETTITGEIKITAADKSTKNSIKNFSAFTGEAVDLGKWTLDGGDNALNVTGQTRPARSRVEIEIEVIVKT